jgi:hypothetical protein
MHSYNVSGRARHMEHTCMVASGGVSSLTFQRFTSAGLRGGAGGWARCSGCSYRLELECSRVVEARVRSACAQVVDVSIRFPGALRKQFYNTSCVFNFLTTRACLHSFQGSITGHDSIVSSSTQGSITGSKLVCSAVITQLSPSSYRMSGPNQRS